MKIKQNKILLSGVLIFTSLSILSCRDEVLSNVNDDSIEDVIKIGANVVEAATTRSDEEPLYIERGKVERGTFTITYPYYYQTINSGLNTWRHLYDYGEVTFGYEGMTQTGIAIRIKDNASEPLRWADTGNASNQGIYVRSGSSYDGDSATLYMDNVSRTDFVTLQSNGTVHQRDSLISFKVDKNPYKAGIFDSVDGSNDLLWGKARAKKYDRYVDFKLHHNMSRLIVKVIVEGAKEEGKLELSLDRATVRIENILTEPLTYNRLTGDLLFIKQTNGIISSDEIQEEQYKPLELVRFDEILKKSSWKKTPSSEDEDEDENETENETETETDAVYETEDFVIPPQILKTDAKRPRLVITIPFEDYNSGMELGEQFNNNGYVEFSGLLPRSMFMHGDEDLGQGNIPVRLDFLKEHVLTITTKMKPGEPELEFMPVTVEKWVNKGSYLPLANQAGIGNISDLMDLIEYYKENNDFQLGRYGYQENISTQYTGLDDAIYGWHFQFRANNIVLPIKDIQGQMIPGGDNSYYVMDLRNRIQLIQMPDGTQRELPMKAISTELYEILTTPLNDGVKTTESGHEFKDLIKAYNSNIYDMWKLCYFGDYDEYTEKWTFKISQDLELDYLDIATMMLPGEKFGLKDFSFVFDTGVSVKVSNVPENFLQNGQPDDGNVSPEDLYKIVAEEQKGIYSLDEFNEMITSQSIEKYVDTKGTIRFWRDITLEETAIQGMLKINDEYSFSTQGKKIILNQYNSSQVSITVSNSGELVKIMKVLSRPSGLGTQESFINLIKAYSGYEDNEEEIEPNPSEISKYGYYDISPNRWTFLVSDNIEIENDIAGKMIPGAGNLNYIFDLRGNSITVKSGEETKIFESSDDLVNYLSTPVIETEEPESPDIP